MDNRIANCQKCGKVSGPAYFFKGKCPYCGYIQGTQGSSPIAGAAHTNNAYDELTAANARIDELEKALEPFAREDITARYQDSWHLHFADPDGLLVISTVSPLLNVWRKLARK